MESLKMLLFTVPIITSAVACSGQDHTSTNPAIKIPNEGYVTPRERSGMQLVWSDEFSGEHLNLSDWKHEIGGHGWGNNELQYYQEKNAFTKDGYLVIQARQESAGGKQYTSSRIITQGKREFQYGRVDIRAMLPKGQGIWPALWMLGNDIAVVDWPACGEIDIMEMIGGEGKDNTLHGTAHWENAGSHTYHGGSTQLRDNKIFADEFHAFSIVWTPSFIIWYLDDKEYYRMDITTPESSEFHHKFYFIFNVAVGGNWPGNPDASTKFPQQMVVDYIRVFQNN